MVKVIKGVDVEALVVHSLKHSKCEMLALRQPVWDMCERCVR
jgi:hypothetical protein